MIKYFNKGEILKGSDAELRINLIPCGSNTEIEDIIEFECDFYTTAGGQAIVKHLEDFEIDGEVVFSENFDEFTN